VHYGGNGKLFFDKQRMAFLNKAAIERQMEAEAFNLFLWEAQCQERAKTADYQLRFRCLEQLVSPGAEIGVHALNFHKFFPPLLKEKFDYHAASLQYFITYAQAGAANKLGNWDFRKTRNWTFALQIKRIRNCMWFFLLLFLLVGWLLVFFFFFFFFLLLSSLSLSLLLCVFIYLFHFVFCRILTHRSDLLPVAPVWLGRFFARPHLFHCREYREVSERSHLE
jgi:hypothetical protein